MVLSLAMRSIRSNDFSDPCTTLQGFCWLSSYLWHRAMGVYEMLKYHAPPILILLHLHLVNNVNLRADEASASALFVCFFPAPRHALSGHLFLQAYDWVEFFSGEGKVSAELRRVCVSGLSWCVPFSPEFALSNPGWILWS